MNEDNLFTVFNNDNVKSFKFVLNDNDKPKYKYYKSLIKRFNSINIKGLILNSCSDYYIKYTIEKKLLRKIKMMSLSNEIKNNSDEDVLLQILQNSVDSDDYSSVNGAWYNMNKYEYSDALYEEKRENNKQLKYQSKQLNQKVKQYNKFRR